MVASEMFLRHMEHVTTCRLVKKLVKNTYLDAAVAGRVALAGRVLKLNYLWRVSSYEVTPFGSNAVISRILRYWDLGAI